MRERTIKILIAGLLGLVMFSSSIALLMYSKQDDLNKYVESHVEVVIASRSLAKGAMITAADIKMGSLPNSYVNFTPLTQAEIIGRYAKVKILATEPLRPEKLTLIKPTNEKASIVSRTEVTKEETKNMKSDTITIPLSIFKNIDDTLKKGDYIDIVSVKPSKSDEYKFDTRYVALHVPIHSFISKSVVVESLSNVIYDESKIQSGITVADSVVLKITPRNVKNLLQTYYKTQVLNSKRVYNSKENKGHLWMVKTTEIIDKVQEKEKSKMLINATPTRIIHRSKRPKNRKKVSISYED